MPTLRKYKPSSKKNGYYIQANVGGSHPITLQVTPIAGKILRKTGYKPNKSIPTKLVWAMYDLDLLYTKKSLDTSNPQDVSTGAVLRNLDLGNRLSRRELNEVINYIDEYSGPQIQALKHLKNDLTNAAESGADAKNSVNQSDIPKTTEEAVSCLFTITNGIRQFRQARQNTDDLYLLKSFQNFMTHPYVDFEQTEVTDDGELRYTLTHPEKENTYRLTDQLPPRKGMGFHDTDYVIQIPDENGNATGVIEDEAIVGFAPAESNSYDKKDLEEDLKWILSIKPVDTNPDFTTMTEYNGIELEPIRRIRNKQNIDMQIVEVDRISNAGNPIVEVGDTHYLLDRGEPGERYLVEVTQQNRWKALSKVVD